MGLTLDEGMQAAVKLFAFGRKVSDALGSVPAGLSGDEKLLAEANALAPLIPEALALGIQLKNDLKD